MLTLKEITPVRLIKNDFIKQIKTAYVEKSSTDTLKKILGRGRAKKGMFEGDIKITQSYSIIEYLKGCNH